MPAQGRLGDKSKVDSNAHGCPSCPHTCLGPATTGSGNVFANSKRALRVGDNGIHAACCGPNTWKAIEGAAHVFINGKAAHRLGDQDKHCGGVGEMIEGSPDVFVGDSGGSPGQVVVTPSFEGGFILLDDDGRPRVDVEYILRTKSGLEYTGRTDEQGRTELVGTDVSQEITVEFIDGGECCGE